MQMIKSVFFTSSIFMLIIFISCKKSNSKNSTNPLSEITGLINKHYELWTFDSITKDSTIINFGYLKRSENNHTLMIYIDGSHYRSAFGIKERDTWIKPGTPSSFGMSVFKDFDILVPEKINIEIGKDHTHDKVVLNYATVEDRVYASSRVIDTYLNSNGYYKTVIIIGSSEGARILPSIYWNLENREKITHLIFSFGNGGISQYKGFKILLQKDGITSLEKKMYTQFEDEIIKIKQVPYSIDKMYFGHSYKRWTSYLHYSSLKEILKIDIKILLLAGVRDYYTPVESARVIVDKFKKKNKKNLTYIEYEEMGHGPGNKEDSIRIIKDMHKFINKTN